MKQILLLIAVVIGQSVLAADKKLITDPIVEKAILKELKKPISYLTKADLEKVWRLDFSFTSRRAGGSQSAFAPQFTDVGLKEVTKCNHLTLLNLGNTKVTDAGLKELAKLQQLSKLNLSATKITDAGLKELAKLQKLIWLGLSDTQITNAGLKEVAKFQQLNTLILSATKITDTGLKEVAKMKQLRHLDLQNTKVTKAGVAQLQKALPKCLIFTFFGS